MSNLQEYFADTNPTNSASLLALVGISPQTNGFWISWIGGTASTQIVERRRNLADPGESWTAIFTNTPLTAITNSLVDAGLSTNMFYRMRAGW